MESNHHYPADVGDCGCPYPTLLRSHDMVDNLTLYRIAHCEVHGWREWELARINCSCPRPYKPPHNLTEPQTVESLAEFRKEERERIALLGG